MYKQKKSYSENTRGASIYTTQNSQFGSKDKSKVKDLRNASIVHASDDSTMSELEATQTKKGKNQESA